ncbi:family 2A encapsulin nanocompartment cargo protein cysteine desulfurase [Lacipirellula sp.]|uniref:family 2A encapsulin nanocompartment cargo protein cysteine desulfurase n=1 Tax=Lacipirellula sp. TaxID=2691419 RepID=UPI003D1157D8
MTINISTASSRDLPAGLPQSTGSLPQPQLGRSLPCDGTLLEGALTRLANELYAAPPGGAAYGMQPLSIGAVPGGVPGSVPGMPAGPNSFTPGGSAGGFGAPLPSSPQGFMGGSGGAPAQFPGSAQGLGSPSVTQPHVPASGFGSTSQLPGTPAVSGLDLTPESSLNAGGGTASPTPPFPTTAGQQQSGVSLPGGHPPQTLQSVDDDRLQSALEHSNISGVPSNRSGAPASGVNSGPSVVPASSHAVNRVEDGSTFYFLNEAHQFARFSAPPSDLLPVPGVSLPSSAPRVSQPIPTGGLALHQPFSVEAIRRDFPILQERVNGHPLVWLDNAATTQKPQSVIDRIAYFYQHENSNIHRAAHELAARATDAYEDARNKVAKFLNASSSSEIVFVRGATEAINLVAKSWGRQHVGKDDEIVLTNLEHHANIVPWQMLAQETGARIRVAPVDDDGQILLDEYQKLITSRTRLVAFPQVSNALGTITPAKEMVAIAQRYGARVLVDGAQAVSHMRADVQSLNADWYVFSGHKVFAPTGIGVLYGKRDLLESTQPWQGGGNMIQDVTFEKTIYQGAPNRFEAGTGNIADAVGLGAAIDYVERLGIENIARYEHDLLVYATRALQSIDGLRLIGTAPEKASVLSFTLAGHENESIGKALNAEGIAVRSGHHCAQPILRRMGVESTVRPSLAMYNNVDDVNRLVEAIHHVKSGSIGYRS